MTLVRKTFLVFILVFIIQLAVISVLLFFGYRHSDLSWREIKDRQASETARLILTGEADRTGGIEYAGQLAVYDLQGNLVATNRGMGMRQAMSRTLSFATKYPVTHQGVQIGYYATGNLSFAEDSANQELIRSMIFALVASLVFSLGIALFAALYVSKKFSHPADRIARSLHTMNEGNLSVRVAAEGTDEMSRIAALIESLRRRLEEERTVRSQWSQDVAHDLRTPVASMKAQLEGMSDGILAPSKDRLDRTIRELGRMEDLIESLEMLMRLESPETKLVPAEIDAEEFSRELFQRFEAQMLRKNIRYSRMIGIETLHADEQLLMRSCANLLANAVRHTEEGGHVELRMDVEGTDVFLQVTNSGKPIPPEELPRVFERLYRGEYARNSAGSGLGLTIVDRIARLHGGSVSIASTEKTGTVVTIRVPRLPV